MPIHILIYCVRPAQCSNCKHLVMMSNFSFSHLIILSFLLVFQSHGTFAAPRDCFVNAIYSFGDSIADTGNLLREGLVGFFATIGNYPYGETYKKPTGRCSDGLLMIDFFAFFRSLQFLDLKWALLGEGFCSIFSLVACGSLCVLGLRLLDQTVTKRMREA